MKNSIRFISVVLMLAILLALLPVSAFAAKEMFLITEVDITGIDAPVVGDNPDMSATCSRTDCLITSVSWTEYDADWEWSRDLSFTDTFRAGYIYVVFVTVDCTASGKGFSSTVICTINGKTANKPTPQDKKIVPYIHYGPLDKSISKVELNVVKPVAGKTPTFAKVSTDTYESKNYTEKISNQTNGCVWTNTSSKVNLTISNPFKAENTYSITYTLFPKDGYQFTSSTTATINGQKAAVEKKGDYLFVTLSGLKPTVPVTTIGKVELTITAPAVGQKPAFTKITGDAFESNSNGNAASVYKNGIAWRDDTGSKNITPGSTAVFEDGKVYTATIVLAAKDGYKFDKSATATVNGKNATVEWVSDDCINVKITFQLDHVHKASDWKSDADLHWKECTACAQILEAKASHVDRNTDGKCDICGAKVTVETPVEKPTEKPTEPTEKPTEPTAKPTEPTEEPTEPVEDPTEAPSTEAPSQDEDPTTAPTTAEKNDNLDDGNTNRNNLVLIIILSVVVAAAIITCVVLLIVKKKK